MQEEKRLKLQQEALELSQKRLQFLEKTKNLLNIGDVPADEPNRKPKAKKPKSYDLYSSGDEGGGHDERGRSRKSGGGSRSSRKPRDRQKEADNRVKYNARMTKDELEDLNDFIDDEEFFAENKEIYEKAKKRSIMMSNEYLSRKQVSFSHV